MCPLVPTSDTHAILFILSSVQYSRESQTAAEGHVLNLSRTTQQGRSGGEGVNSDRRQRASRRLRITLTFFFSSKRSSKQYLLIRCLSLQPHGSEEGLDSQYIYIRTVSSQRLLSALLNWFNLVYGPIGLSNMQLKPNFGPHQSGRN